MIDFGHAYYNPQRFDPYPEDFSPPHFAQLHENQKNVTSLPRFFQGKAFTAYRDGTLKCTSDDFSEQYWTFRFGAIEDSYRNGQILVTEGAVFINHGENFYHVDIETGRLKNHIEGRTTYLEHSVAGNGRLYCKGIGKEGFEGFAYDIASQKIIWEKAIGVGFDSIFSLWEDHLIVYSGGDLMAIDTLTGNQKWWIDVREIGAHEDYVSKEWIEGELCNFPIVVGDLLYVPVFSVTVLCIHIPSGEIRWRAEKDLYVGSWMMSYQVREKKLVILDGSFLKELNAHTGELIRKEKFEVRDLYMPGLHAASQSHFYLVSSLKGKVVALDKEMLNPDWTYTVPAQVSQGKPPMIYKGKLYILGMDRNLYVYA